MPLVGNFSDYDPDLAGQTAPNLNQVAVEWLSTQLHLIAKHVDKDLLAILGLIDWGVDSKVRMALEQPAKKSRVLLVLLDTPGGLVEVVQRIANTLRHHYETVQFLVLDRAMSAGTVLAMSGDAIYMDYYACLGSTDPQFVREGRAVPALSYLRIFEELNEKSKTRELTTAEAILLNKMDFAELEQIRLAEEKAVSLIEEWLSTYKFKDWKKDGVQVSDQMKKERAQQIAKTLSDHNKWKMHGHGIHKNVLESELNLKIDDYGPDHKLKYLLLRYYHAALQYNHSQGKHSLVHNRSLVL